MAKRNKKIETTVADGENVVMTADGFRIEGGTVKVEKAPKVTLKGTIMALKAQLESNFTAVEAGILALAARQTDDELSTADTKHKNYAGFSSSNAYHGTKIATALTAGEPLTADQKAWALRICLFHARQLAKIWLGA